MDTDRIYKIPPNGKPSPFSCPECGGVLWETQDGTLTHFRCRVGHAYSPLSLAAAHADNVEDTLWTALRSMEESASHSRQLVNYAEEQRQERNAAELRARAEEAERYATNLRAILAEIRSTFMNHSHQEDLSED
jgi:two-component system chemotaxis response regulator CheB